MNECNYRNNNSSNNTREDKFRAKDLEEDAEMYRSTLLRRAKQPKDGWDTAETRLNQILQRVEERGQFHDDTKCIIKNDRMINSNSMNNDNKNSID